MVAIFFLISMIQRLLMLYAYATKLPKFASWYMLNYNEAGIKQGRERQAVSQASPRELEGQTWIAWIPYPVNSMRPI